MSNRNKRGMDQFDQALRRWANRPPSIPPEVVGRRIAASLRPVRTGLPVWRMTAAAAAVVLLICGTWAGLQFTDGARTYTQSPRTPARSAEFVPPPLDDNVVLWWLDDETPVYFVLNTGDAG